MRRRDVPIGVLVGVLSMGVPAAGAPAGTESTSAGTKTSTKAAAVARRTAPTKAGQVRLRGASALAAKSGFFAGPPLEVAAGLFDAKRPRDLGLARAAGAETVTIFSPAPSSDHFSNGVVMIGFKGQLFAQWQSSATDEDSADTWVAYSHSSDGKSWAPPSALVSRWQGGIRTSGGWWTDGETLVAYVNAWPSGAKPRGGYTEYITSQDGQTWSKPERLMLADGSPLNGVFEQDPHRLPDGRILNAAHFQPGLRVAPCYTDDASGTRGWVRADFTTWAFPGDTTRELEPSSFRRADGALVMVFRDQGGSFKTLASLSYDDGESWMQAVETNLPDSRAKQSAGNLPDGTAYIVNNPAGNRTRVPLVLTLSRGGQRFDKAFVLRAGDGDLPAQRTPGRAKLAGYSYPKSMLWKDSLYVAYSTNEEDVQYTRVPLASLAY
jgi:hypothetical protein